MKPTPEQVTSAMRKIGAPGIVRHFPADADSREMIMEYLMARVPSVECLRWITNKLILDIGEWTDLRALSELIGDWREKQEHEETARRIEGWKRESALVEESDRKLIESAIRRLEVVDQ